MKLLCMGNEYKSKIYKYCVFRSCCILEGVVLTILKKREVGIYVAE